MVEFAGSIRLILHLCWHFMTNIWSFPPHGRSKIGFHLKQPMNQIFFDLMGPGKLVHQNLTLKNWALVIFGSSTSQNHLTVIWSAKSWFHFWALVSSNAILHHLEDTAWCYFFLRMTTWSCYLEWWSAKFVNLTVYYSTPIKCLLWFIYFVDALRVCGLGPSNFGSGMSIFRSKFRLQDEFGGASLSVNS